MDVVRRFSLFATAGLLGIAVLLGWVTTRPPMTADTAGQLARATAYFDSTIVLARVSRPRGVRGDELAISLGLLERLRLGLGSPFRLVDEALADPRLEPSRRDRVAWALLGRLSRGDAYVVDPSALEGWGPWSADGRGATGAAHLALIEHAIRSASDPRAGELAVRLAYVIAAAKGSIATEAVEPAASIAALIRDRELAREDLRDLLADAAEHHTNVFELLSERRIERAFRVEQPPMAPLSAALRTEAMNAVPALVRALDTLDQVATPALSERPTTPVIGTHFAARLRELGEERPPMAEVVVTLHGYPRNGFHATNEETLAAGSALLADADSVDSTRRASALALVASAVAVRPLAQSAPWFPGDEFAGSADAPDVTDLTSEFGLKSVTFSRAVPMSWRPYYLRELRDGLRDMEDVFPAFSVNGLRVQFDADDMRDSALAMHNPRTRALELSVVTSAGTLAHELAHDLDWQAARRLYAHGSGYSTDRAMREKRGPLATSVRGLADARIVRSFSGPLPPLNDRPAELFARGTDWFVASTLAQEGRVNGFLTAVQDPMLSGYAAGPPTALGSAAAGSLVSAIEQITYLPDSTREAFMAQWADPELVDPMLLVRRVLETPALSRGMDFRFGMWRRGSSFTVPLSQVRLPSPSVCVANPSPEAMARERLLMLAIDARAEGLALRRARYRALVSRVPWAGSIVAVPPTATEDGERSVEALRTSVVSGLTTALADQGVLPLVPSIFRANASSCANISR